MANKIIHKITWNKPLEGQEHKPSYELGSTNANNVYINTGVGEKKITLQTLFSWIKDFFEKGVFTHVGENEPQSLQTKIWFDTTVYSLFLKNESTINLDRREQSIRLIANVNNLVLLEKPDPEWSINLTDSFASPVYSGGLHTQVGYAIKAEDWEENNHFLLIKGVQEEIEDDSVQLDYNLKYYN